MLTITNFTDKQLGEEWLKKIARTVQAGEKQTGTISLVFVGPGRMRKLNKKYRKKNKVTNVLAFRNKETKDFLISPEEKNFLGEIVICLREIKKSSTRLNISFEKELARVFIHGILHLLGYDHIQPRDQQKMTKKEEEYLNKIFQ